jgi:hypothetical protein
MSNGQCFLIAHFEGGDALYCKDGKFRKSVQFGTPSSTLKLWKKPAYAHKVGDRRKLDSYTIKWVYPEDRILHDGTVVNRRTGN